MAAPLDGVFVLDLSRVLAGPFCTMLLGDLGARVVKVEQPGEGDVTRGWAPPHDPRSGLSAYYLSINRNKESIALDLTSEKGSRSVEILAARADILVENFPPGGMEKFGLSLEALRRANPRLITASITGNLAPGTSTGDVIQEVNRLSRDTLPITMQSIPDPEFFFNNPFVKADDSSP